MAKRRSATDLEIGMRFLEWAIVTIRTAAQLGDAPRARRLADAVHGLPTALLHESAELALANVRVRCERHGEIEWFDQAMRFAQGVSD